MDGDIIDIQGYLDRESDRAGSVFAVWGAEGERARLALPLWRAVYLLGSDRGGIVRVPRDRPGELIPFFVLDLGEEPARTTFSRAAVDLLSHADPPSLITTPDGDVGIFLGEELEHRWYLLLLGRRAVPVQGKDREDLLFLAGECAGLLFLRELARNQV